MRPSVLSAAVLAASLGLTATFAHPPDRLEAQSDCHVWAYYMGFWTGPGAWQHQGDVLTDRPARGDYSTTDAGTMAAQIEEAQSAGIDAFIVDWWGPSDGGTTGALSNALDRAAERGFRIAAAIDSFGGQNNVGRGAMSDAIRHLVADRTHHPAYLRYQGRPVIFFAFQQSAGLSLADWQALRAEIDPARDTIWLAEGTKTCPLCGSVMDGMYAFNMAWSDGRPGMYTRDRDVVLDRGGWLYVPTVHPGWDESRVAARDGRPNPTGHRERAGGQFLRSLWSGAAASGSDIRLVVSWNEFIENSHIEPSRNHGRAYLDVVRDLAAQGCGAAPDRADVEAQRAETHVAAVSRNAEATDALLAEGAAQQLLELNPGAALQRRILDAGFVPTSPEYDVTVGDGSWRGQRAEHLGTGEVRVYYVRVGTWGSVSHVVRGTPDASAHEDALLGAAAERQRIQLNPAAALQRRILGDGFVPTSAEFRLAIAGSEWAAQRAEHLGTGEVRVYHAPVSDYAAVAWVGR